MAKHARSLTRRVIIAWAASALIIAIGGLALAIVGTSHMTSAPVRPAVTAPPYHPSHSPIEPVRPSQGLVPTPSKQLSYTVVSGDTLWGIAGSHCGNPLRWPHLWHANMKLITNPNLIFPKEVISLVC